MGGTKAGGIKAKETIKAKYGGDYYTKLGKQGGSSHTKGGFKYLAENDPKKLSELSNKGGRISRRTK
jgi:hypothetical protein